ncbi:ABC transporter ATP-binding protein [Labedella phragmitis]|uniref:ABC transporter ATP-binding protein n=1 Tax=Labedella phragmitis TaxID=2498849 RepID=A0A3S5CC26_9MICO|nr:ATP-binding cassette domain-containing protein [Labedella phragmitis]RWZ46626.1 ABC transporter ATP-binding protein [Labedella phragmitis]
MSTTPASPRVTPGTPLVELRGVSRDYTLPRANLFTRPAVTHALAPTTLAVQSGEALGVIGESGSGKSTLVRLLTALDTPTSGEVLFDGQVVSGRSDASLRWLRREVGVVFQDPYASLDPRMTVGRIVAEPLVALGVDGDRRGRVREMLRLLGLGPEFGDRYPHELSGGQRQRVAIARALVHRPKLLVGDEPLSALDVTVRASILDLVGTLKQDLGFTLVLVSHDIGVVARLCDRVVVMTEGEVVEQGATDTVLAAPQHAYTRRLLASVPTLD